MPLGGIPYIRSICWNEDDLVFTILCSSENLSKDELKQAGLTVIVSSYDGRIPRRHLNNIIGRNWTILRAQRRPSNPPRTDEEKMVHDNFFLLQYCSGLASVEGSLNRDAINA